MFITKLLPVVFPAYLICLHMLLNTNETEGASFQQVDTTTQHVRTDIIRYYRLFNKCSQHHLQIWSGGLNAKANAKDFESRYSMLEVESRAHGALTIRGNISEMYLCFRKNGKLTHKPRLYKNRELNWRCLFVEAIVGGYSVFHLQKNPNWTVSFNKQGKPLVPCTNGTQKMRHVAHCHPDSIQMCNQFMKRADEDSPFTPDPIGPEKDSDKLAAAADMSGKPGTPQKTFKGPLSPQQELRKRKMKGKRRRRSRITTTTSSPAGLADSPAPLVRIRREDQELLRTLRIMKLVL